MAQDNFSQDNDKKGFPTSFFLLLLGIILAIMTVQNFVSVKRAQVSFSHQLEHLVNLNLVVPEESRKVSINDNLVSFSGRFREVETPDSKKRYKFLELLALNHDLNTQKEELQADLLIQKEKVEKSANWFLALSGEKIPVGGFHIVDTPAQINGASASVVLYDTPKWEMISLPLLESRLKELQGSNDLQALEVFEAELSTALDHYRSPVLGISSQSLKDELRTAKSSLDAVQGKQNLSPKARLTAYESVLARLREVTNQLNTPNEGLRLEGLRSVRLYQEEVRKIESIDQKLEQNQVQLDKARSQVSQAIWFFNNKELSTRALERQDSEAYRHWFNQAKEEWQNFKQNRGLSFRAPDQPRNVVLEKKFKSEEPSPNYVSYLFTFLPVIFVLLLLYFMFSRQMKGMGGGAMNFGKSPAKLLQTGKNKITFADVAGIDEAKEELVEVVDFLKNPMKFTALGGRIPKGVLLIGPPGTGKTLVAKAVAGEADRPFFSIAGSDFVEMFVGVGASRIRDMFDQAKKNAPCIIFIDEIDAVGRHRGAGIGGGHDEREQTLNQLLVEMDGFDTNEGVILMAATNRPDVLDKALLRPGRFDRRVSISLPDIKGRSEILKVHARKIKIDPTVDLLAVAKSTPGASGADLENLLNEAALLAARNGRSAVTSGEVSEARDKVLYGKERRSLELGEAEKRTTAYHESGHAIVGLAVEHSDPVDKVTIIPRGMSLGATHFLPEKNRVSYWKKEVVDQMAVLMGGRVAEEIFLGDVSSGAQQDIAQATQLARSMVCKWGMSDTLGLVSYEESSGGDTGYVTHAEKTYSDETARAIDDEVRKIVQEGYKRAHEILEERRAQVELMAQSLMEFETLDARDVQDIVHDRFDKHEKGKRLSDAEKLFKREPETPPPLPPQISQQEADGDLGLSPSV
jgi:cell division protease FtsH